jgi:hypothetical protein
MQSGFPQQWDGKQIAQIALYDKDRNEYELDQAERFNAFGFNKFKGWECNAGYQGCVIRENEVKRSYRFNEHQSFSSSFKLDDRKENFNKI